MTDITNLMAEAALNRHAEVERLEGELAAAKDRAERAEQVIRTIDRTLYTEGRYADRIARVSHLTQMFLATITETTK